MITAYLINAKFIKVRQTTQTCYPFKPNSNHTNSIHIDISTKFIIYMYILTLKHTKTLTIWAHNICALSTSAKAHVTELK